MKKVLKRDGDRYRIALLGAGYISEWHAKAILATRNLSLSAVCDKSLSKAEGLAASFSIPKIFGDIEQLAVDPDIDSVHVLLPPDLHFRAAKTLLEHRKHVFIEKPMCLSTTECSDLTHIAASNDVRIGVGHNFLFHSAYDRLRQDVQAGRLGWVDHVSVTWHKELPQLRYGPYGIWMLREPKNVLFEIGSHTFAYVNDLVALPQSLSVSTGNPRLLPTGVSIPQNWLIHAQENGVLTTISMALALGFSEHSVHVRGSLGSATADLEKNTYVLRTHSASPEDFDRHQMCLHESKSLRRDANRGLRNYLLSKFIRRIPGNAYGHSIQSAIEAFYHSSEDVRLSGESGKRVIGLCERASEAIPQLPKQAKPDHPVSITLPSSKPKILVLGATGFIGQELCRELISKGHSIRVLVRDPSKLPTEFQNDQIETVKGDLECEKDIVLALNGIDYVFHLARAMVNTWDDYQKHDVKVTERLALACLDENVKLLIYTGTIDSYYAGADSGTIDEQTPYDPEIKNRNLYARSKAASEDLLMQLRRERGLPVTIVRPGIVIGRGGSPFHWGIGMWHFNSVVQVWGDGGNKLPFVLVEDVAEGLVKLVGREDLSGQSFNLIGAPMMTANEYLDVLETYSGIKLKKENVGPWRFYANDLLKWMVKMVVRHPERRVPSYRDWESRTQKADFDCSQTQKTLDWSPTSNHETFVHNGIYAPIDEWRSN